jgi:hypothetical protein
MDTAGSREETGIMIQRRETGDSRLVTGDRKMDT